MVATQWADVSEWQVPVDDRYPWPVFCFRSNDGAHRDAHFTQNRAWADKAVATNRLAVAIVYYFYRPRIDAAAVLRSMVGAPGPRTVVMIDVEGDGGKVAGDQSSAVNQQWSDLGAWLGDPRRVIGYGNTGDLDKLWPHKPAGLRVVIAAYGTNPPYPPYKFAHQYADNVSCAPFGPCDANSADGMSVADLEVMFGFTAPPPTPSAYRDEDDMIIEEPNGDVLQLVYGGTATYWRPLPTNAAKLVPASGRIKDDGSLKALWKTGSA